MTGVKRAESKGCVKSVLSTKCSAEGRIIVIKIGTSSLIRQEHGTLHLSNLARVCETVKALHSQGHYVILVSSGAMGVGCQRMGLAHRPTKIAQKQALAAIGQVHLMRYYEDFLQALGLTCAQVLLTLDNLSDRHQYINARNTFTELLAYGTVPIVNENDTVAGQELRFGDNDTLSAQVAVLVDADYLFVLTDVDALYTSNPKRDPTATPIHDVHDISALTADTSTTGTQWGTGGMVTKLTAARIATAAGCTMVICSSADPENIIDIMDGEVIGTKFHPLQHVLKGRKRWILSVPLRGALHMDTGAVRAVRDKHKSLFSAGILKVVGDFSAQDAVSLCDAAGVEFARGLVNFSSEECGKARGKSSNELQALLGYQTAEEVVHRANITLLSPELPESKVPSLCGGSDSDSGHDSEDWRQGSTMKQHLAAHRANSLNGAGSSNRANGAANGVANGAGNGVGKMGHAVGNGAANGIGNGMANGGMQGVEDLFDEAAKMMAAEQAGLLRK